MDSELQCIVESTDKLQSVLKTVIKWWWTVKCGRQKKLWQMINVRRYQKLLKCLCWG